MKLAIGSDHGGYDMKKTVIAYVKKLGHDVEDAGCFSKDSVDYPEIAEKVCSLIQDGVCEQGILICGTGIGMSIAANRHRNIRAALCHEAFTARMSRQHNNANVCCLGGRVLGIEVALDVVHTWVNASFEGGRHQRRIDMFS
ncbi:MAG TPA: ribose 5-phosphate isomerase B [Desulfobulbaceae bacterium]|nr:ribose 5-phosphate isomerase B [Desulfobulbaceae bacterium]